jgi:large subunit ribosomal protein L2
MGIKKYRPTSAGRRAASVSDFKDLTPGAAPEKSLLIPVKKKGGRNNQGYITARHRGGGHKQMYRVIDFRREKDGVPAVVNSIQYDPNRNCRIALLFFVDGEKRYILAPEGLKAGDKIENGPESPPTVGNCLPLKNVPLGSAIHAVELAPGRGAALCRAAGMSAVLLAREAGWAQISLPSGEIRRVPVACRATIGKLGNADAMNVDPIDHPHGGGEGRTKGGRHPVSPTGVLAKGGFTRKRRKPTNKAIVRRRKSTRYGQLKLR